MSVKGNVKEAAGFIKEETGEKLKNDKMAQEGRNLRNEGRMEDGQLPRTGKPGDGTAKVESEIEDANKKKFGTHN